MYLQLGMVGIIPHLIDNTLMKNSGHAQVSGILTVSTP
jgi:hypothetical protein